MGLATPIEATGPGLRTVGIQGALILAQVISIPGSAVSGAAMDRVDGHGPTGGSGGGQYILSGAGLFYDGISLMLMTLPIVFPVMTGGEFNPGWRGVVVTIPVKVSMNRHILTGIAGNRVTRMQAARASVSCWLRLLPGVVILTIFPAIALFLPHLIY